MLLWSWSLHSNRILTETAIWQKLHVVGTYGPAERNTEPRKPSRHGYPIFNKDDHIVKRKKFHSQMALRSYPHADRMKLDPYLSRNQLKWIKNLKCKMWNSEASRRNSLEIQVKTFKKKDSNNSGNDPKTKGPKTWVWPNDPESNWDCMALKSMVKANQTARWRDSLQNGGSVQTASEKRFTPRTSE